MQKPKIGNFGYSGRGVDGASEYVYIVDMHLVYLLELGGDATIAAASLGKVWGSNDGKSLDTDISTVLTRSCLFTGFELGYVIV